jgi:hypothetical protein
MKYLTSQFWVCYLLILTANDLHSTDQCEMEGLLKIHQIHKLNYVLYKNVKYPSVIPYR